MSLGVTVDGSNGVLIDHGNGVLTVQAPTTAGGPSSISSTTGDIDISAAPGFAVNINNFSYAGPLLLDGSAGTAGQVATSQGPSLDAIWSTPLLSGLGDVVLTSPVTGNVLEYDGTDWVNVPATGLIPTTAVNLQGGVAGSMPWQSAASTTGFTAAGTTGQVLLSGGTGVPTWATSAPQATNLTAGVAGAIPFQSAANTTGFSAAGTVGQVLLSGGTSTPTWSTSAPQSTNITGGVAGAMPYQSAVNTTAFTAAGSIGQVLVSQGTSAPTWANTAPEASNLSGGVAGSVVYQSAAGTTGYTPVGTAGQVLQSNGAAAPTWVNPVGARGFTFTITGNSTLTGILSTAGVTDRDGNVYCIYNNSGSTVTVTFPLTTSIINGSSTAASTQTSPGVITLQSYETLEIQTYSAIGQQYTYVNKTIPQDWSCVAFMSSMGAPPANTDTVLNFRVDGNGGSAPLGHDPIGAFNNGTHTWTCPRTGMWQITLQVTMNNANTTTTLGWNQQIRVNGASSGTGGGTLTFGSAMPSSGATSSANGSATSTVLIQLAQGATVNATVYPYGTTQLTPSNNSSNCTLAINLVG